MFDWKLASVPLPVAAAAALMMPLVTVLESSVTLPGTVIDPIVPAIVSVAPRSTLVTAATPPPALPSLEKVLAMLLKISLAPLPWRLVALTATELPSSRPVPLTVTAALVETSV